MTRALLQKSRVRSPGRHCFFRPRLAYSRAKELAMKQNILLLVVAGLSFTPGAGLFAGQAEKAAKPAPAKKAVLRAASEMKWVDIPEAKGAQQAVVWGNPQKGPHSSFAKFAGGTELPMHTHTAGSRSVVIAGT